MDITKQIIKKVESFLLPKRAAIAVVLLYTLITFRNTGGFDSYTQDHVYPKDFHVYFHAKERAFSGITPYQSEPYYRNRPYRYAPGAIIPFFWFPNRIGEAWFFQKILYLLSLATAILLGATFRQWKDVAFLVFGIILADRGVSLLFHTGQIELFFFVLTVIASRLWVRGAVFSGALLGVLPWFKPLWITMMVPFLQPFKQQTKKLYLGFLVSCLLFSVILPSCIFGLSNTITWTQSWLKNFRIKESELFFDVYNCSIWSVLARFLYQDGSIWSLCLLPVFTILLIYFGVKETQRSVGIDSRIPFSWLPRWFILIQLLSPFGWIWNEVLLVAVPWAIPHSTLIRNKKQSWALFSLILGLILLWKASFFFHFNLPLIGSIDLHRHSLTTFYWILLFALVI